MGMTRDEALKIWLPIIQMGVETMPECKEALDMAIDTMRKYQKIREIAFPLQFCTTDKLNHEAIMKICEVLEDGNDD